MIEEKCKTCGYGRQIQGIKTIMKCDCPLSGNFNTDVIEAESCGAWKKATEEYLKIISQEEK